jgi:threonylcarbamoyladenosine tRNA methylthiotransferase MtaB
MNRKYDTGFFINITESIKRKIPGITFTTDIITGFPGETDEDFYSTLAMMEKTGFSKTHVFKFSPRANTVAAKMKLQVDEKTKKDRSRMARELADKLRHEYIRSNTGKTLEVVLEEYNEKTGIANGTSENYIRLFFAADLEKYYAGKSKILIIKTGRMYKDGLFGTLI